MLPVRWIYTDCQNLQEKDDSTSASPKQRTNKGQQLIQKIVWRKYRQRGFGATNCRTIKERSDKYIERCSRSFSILAVDHLVFLQSTQTVKLLFHM